MKQHFYFAILAAGLLVWTGCSGSESGGGSSSSAGTGGSGSSTPASERNLPQASVPGAGSGGAAPAAAPSQNQPEERMIGGRMRRIPAVGIPGAGSLPPAQPSQPASGAVAGGMANGLFPQAGAGGGGAFASVSGFGALFPQSVSGMGSVASADNANSGVDSRGRNLPQASVPGGGRNLPQASVPGGGNQPGGRNLPRGAGDRVGDAGGEAPSALAAGSYLERAAALFKEGREDAAVKALYAHMLIDSSAFKDYPLEWFPGLKEPRVFFRWGIGVTFSPHRDYSGIPPLIGDEVDSAAPRGSDDLTGTPGGSNSATGSPSNSRYGKVDTKIPAGMLLYYTGDYIERLYKRLNDRRTGGDGYFGRILKEMPERGEASEGQRQRPQSAQDRARAGRNIPQAAAGGGGGAPGEGGSTAAPESANRDVEGAAASSSLLDRFSTSQDASAPSGNILGTLMPGVMCVGEGTREELLERAAGMELDALIVFDVKVSESRKKFFSNTVLRVYDPKNPKLEIAKAKTLRNTTVMEDRERSGERDDPVELALDRVFQDFVDENFKGSPMPELKPEHVEGRVDTILANPGDKLRAAVEVMGYFREGLLEASRAQAALDELLGGGGQLLISGQENLRKAFVEELLKEVGGRNVDGIR